MVMVKEDFVPMAPSVRIGLAGRGGSFTQRDSIVVVRSIDIAVVSVGGGSGGTSGRWRGSCGNAAGAS